MSNVTSRDLKLVAVITSELRGVDNDRSVDSLKYYINKSKQADKLLLACEIALAFKRHYENVVGVIDVNSDK